jgi:hypothetical protein
VTNWVVQMAAEEAGVLEELKTVAALSFVFE